MADLGISLLKLLTAKPFQRSPRPQVNVQKLTTGIQRMGEPDVTVEQVISALQTLKGRGYANTTPKILMPDELQTASFEIWITPLGRDTLAAALQS